MHPAKSPWAAQGIEVEIRFFRACKASPKKKIGAESPVQRMRPKQEDKNFYAFILPVKVVFIYCLPLPAVV
jgi:hypothetical protein